MLEAGSYSNGFGRGWELVHPEAEGSFPSGTEGSAFGGLDFMTWSGSLPCLGCAGLDFGRGLRSRRRAELVGWQELGKAGLEGSECSCFRGFSSASRLFLDLEVRSSYCSGPRQEPPLRSSQPSSGHHAMPCLPSFHWHPGSII